MLYIVGAKPTPPIPVRGLGSETMKKGESLTG